MTPVWRVQSALTRRMFWIEISQTLITSRGGGREGDWSAKVFINLERETCVPPTSPCEKITHRVGVSRARDDRQRKVQLDLSFSTSWRIHYQSRNRNWRDIRWLCLWINIQIKSLGFHLEEREESQFGRREDRPGARPEV